MFVIRPEQMDRLSAIQAERFTVEMAEHVRHHYAEETRTQTDAVLKSVIEAQIERASIYGIQSRRDVCEYLNLSFEFGEQFDRLPWAVAILRDPWAQKARRLYEAALVAIAESEKADG